MPPGKGPTKYEQILCHVLKTHHTPGVERLEWNRGELDDAADALGIGRVKNLGDLVYTYRSRADTPPRINATAPAGKEWIIRGAGMSKYRFDLIPSRSPSCPTPPSR